MIAVDVGGTLCASRSSLIGEPKRDVIARLKAEQAAGAKVILWTCRTGKLLQDAVGFCEALGIHPDAINENLPERIAAYGGDSRKVSADEYWDDKSVLIN